MDEEFPGLKDMPKEEFVGEHYPTMYGAASPNWKGGISLDRNEYNQRPEVKEKNKEYQKEYHQRPENKAKAKEYYERNRDEILSKQNKYNQRPEVKAKIKAYDRKRYQTPERKAYLKEYRLSKKYPILDMFSGAIL